MDMVKVGGKLYISFPIGDKTEVHFNAQRIFHFKEIFSWPKCNALDLLKFDYVDASGQLVLGVDDPFQRLNSQNPIRGLGIYTFTKRTSS